VFLNIETPIDFFSDSKALCATALADCNINVCCVKKLWYYCTGFIVIIEEDN